MTEYTPTTENIPNCYIYSSEGYDGSLQIPERQSRAEFDRWLNEIRAEAWDEGRRAEELGWTHAWDGHPVPEGDTCAGCMVENPYRNNEK